jgi:hypothetical protein
VAIALNCKYCSLSNVFNVNLVVLYRCNKGDIKVMRLFVIFTGFMSVID